MTISLIASSRVSPKIFEQAGLCGSDSSALRLCYALVGRHRTQVFTSTNDEGVVRSVSFYPLSRFDPSSYVDVLIFFRIVPPAMLERSNARITIWWITDVPDSTMSPVDLSRIDRVIAISQFQRRIFLAFHPSFDPTRVIVIEHGVDMTEYLSDSDDSAKPLKVENRLIYCSSPARGLTHLVDILPRIQRELPSTELLITFDYTLRGRRPEIDFFRRCFESLANVRYLGKLSREELVAAQKSSMIMVYPATYAEGFCLSALECMAAGAVPVTSSYGALDTTLGEGGIPVSGIPGSHVFAERFSNTIVELLRDDVQWSALSEQARRRASTLSWDQISDKFDNLFNEIIVTNS